MLHQDGSGLLENVLDQLQSGAAHGALRVHCNANAVNGPSAVDGVIHQRAVIFRPVELRMEFAVTVLRRRREQLGDHLAQRIAIGRLQIATVGGEHSVEHIGGAQNYFGEDPPLEAAISGVSTSSRVWESSLSS